MTLFNCRVPSVHPVTTTYTSYCFFSVFSSSLPPYQSLTRGDSTAGTAVSLFGFLFPFSQHADGRGDAQTTTTTRRRMRV